MVVNSVSVYLPHMNECLLTLNMWNKIQTIYLADSALTSCTSCPYRSLGWALPAHGHAGLLSAPHAGQGFLTLGLEGRSLPLLRRFSPALPTWQTPCPALRSQRKWHLPSPTPSSHPTPSKLVSSSWLSVHLVLFLLRCHPAHNQLSNF